MNEERRPKMVRTNVSAATRADARGGDSLGELLAAEDALRAERDALSLRKSQIDARLGEIANEIRGDRLTSFRYKQLTAEQDQLKREAVTLLASSQQLKRQAVQISHDVQQAKRAQTVAGVHDVTNALLRELLAEVRAIKARLPIREDQP